MKLKQCFLCTLTIFFWAQVLSAKIVLPALFSHHMVLQQDSEVTIWGWGQTNEVVNITPSWATDMMQSDTIDNTGRWEMVLQTPAAGGPHELIIEGKNKIVIEDILIGEVWLGSGQSNMQWSTSMGGINDGEAESKTANFPEIRLFSAPLMTADYPQEHVIGEWVKCTPETMEQFSAVMYFFGRELHQSKGFPVGLIHSSWGGTPIEVWIPEPIVEADRLLQKNARILNPTPWGPYLPGKAYNAMIHPLVPFTIKGVLWYQGESNAINPQYYARSQSTLIETWRDLWGYDFPFYYVQIAPFAHYGERSGTAIRDQQRKVMDMVENTGMVVISDIGDLQDIHPGNKQDVGKRLAYWALHHQYGEQRIGYSGPLIEDVEVANRRLTLHFKHNDGLHTFADQVLFEVNKGGEEWTTESGLIVNDRIIIETPEAFKIKSVRYGWSETAEADLFNVHNLPASTFWIEIKKD